MLLAELTQHSMTPPLHHSITPCFHLITLSARASTFGGIA